jgi:hypothetical protein
LKNVRKYGTINTVKGVIQMKAKRIYELAYMGSMEYWGRRLEEYKNNPTSSVLAEREREAWKECEEITKLYNAERNKK